MNYRKRYEQPLNDDFFGLATHRELVTPNDENKIDFSTPAEAGSGFGILLPSDTKQKVKIY